MGGYGRFRVRRVLGVYVNYVSQMELTRLSLLERAQRNSQDGWTELAELYRPLVERWLGRRGLSSHDAEELTQDILQVVVQRLPAFEHTGRAGAFRKWLLVITANHTKAYWRKRQSRPQPFGGPDSNKVLESLEEPESDLVRAWNEEHDRHILSCLLEKTLRTVNEQTATTFRMLVIEEKPAEEVAKAVDLPVGAVYSVKSRVLRRLRKEAEGMIDSFHFR